MAFIDLTVQTILLGGTLVLSLRVLFDGGAVDAWTRVLYTATVGAMFIGPWQMLSSVITTAARVPQFRQRAVHLVTSIMYLVIVFGTNAVATNPQLNGMYNPFTVAFVYGIPAALAIFYYSITIKNY